MLRSVLIFRRQAFSCQQPSGRFSTAAEREMEKLKKIFIKPDISTNAKVSNEVMASHSLTTANSLDMLKFKIGKHVRKFKAHETDTGSSSIQIAAFTERINNLARHAAQHKKDKSSIRGLEMLVSRRKRMMQYLKRKDIRSLEKVVVTLGIEKEALALK